jgi:NTE family protein
VGVLRALTEADVPIDAIVGTSSGALVGAIYAAGQLENFARQMLDLEWTDVLAMWDPVWPRAGIMSGSKALGVLAGVIGDWRIEDLPIPFGAVSVDLVSGEEVLIRHGRVLDAIRASISIPGIFVPQRHGRRLLVDGAIRNPVPVSALDELDIDVRIAVNLHHDPVREIVSMDDRPERKRPTVARRVTEAIDTRLARFRKKGRSPAAPNEGAQKNVPNLFEILTASMGIIEYELAQYRLARDPVDVLIEPRVPGIRAFEFHKARQAFAAGEEAAQAHLSDIDRELRRRRSKRRATP